MGLWGQGDGQRWTNRKTDYYTGSSFFRRDAFLMIVNLVFPARFHDYVDAIAPMCGCDCPFSSARIEISDPRKLGLASTAPDYGSGGHSPSNRWTQRSNRISDNVSYFLPPTETPLVQASFCTLSRVPARSNSFKRGISVQISKNDPNHPPPSIKPRTSPRQYLLPTTTHCKKSRPRTWPASR